MEGQTPKATTMDKDGDGWLDGTSTDWISRRITDRSSGLQAVFRAQARVDSTGFYYSELALNNAAFSND
jgi:hypothetical protein